MSEPNDPLVRLARLRAVKISAEIEAQFIATEGFSPVLALLRRLQIECAEALVGLISIDADKPEDVRTLQGKVRQFNDIILILRDLINEGKEADTEISEAERNELLDFLTLTPEGQAEAVELGLVHLTPTDQ